MNAKWPQEKLVKYISELVNFEKQICSMNAIGNEEERDKCIVHQNMNILEFVYTYIDFDAMHRHINVNQFLLEYAEALVAIHCVEKIFDNTNTKKNVNRNEIVTKLDHDQRSSGYLEFSWEHITCFKHLLGGLLNYVRVKFVSIMLLGF